MATDDDHSASSEQITANEEIQMLPRGWKMRAKGKSNRVAFYRPNESQAGADKKDTFDHPVLGRLPRPWELRKKGPGKFVYYNTETGKAASRGPRRVVPPLTTTARPPPGAVVVAARTFGQQQKQQHVRKLKRQETSCVPLHDEYERTRCLDDGKGAIGGMNDGIYVVRKKVTGQLFVEKNYSGAVPHLIPLIKSEINMMKGLLHSSIIHYVASFIQDDPFRATVYMEYCDRGSLRDLILAYKARKKSHQPDWIPESFIWHAFVGLADALGFLATGRSHVSLSPSLASSSSAPNQQHAPSSSWSPIVHRDIKPDNIFLRSRNTPGSTKPLYVVLSDFGLAQYEQRDAAPVVVTAPPGLVGSPEYHAPELAFDPFPRDDVEAQLQASPHTGRSDVWALACIVYCLCSRDDLAHLDRNCRPLRSRRAVGRAAKRPVLDISHIHSGASGPAYYSPYLTRSVAWAAARDPADRPDGWELVVEVTRQRDRWAADPACGARARVDGGGVGVLPGWAAGTRAV